MRIEVTGVQGTGFVEVTTSHKGKELRWNTSAYRKVKLADPKRVFKEINDFLEYVGEDVQDNLWNSYVKIHDLFNMDMDLSHIVNSLVHFIHEIYKQIPMNTMRRWLLTIGNLHIPADVQKVITADSRYNQRDQTYLEHDYINLSTVALALRLMVPIWGEYIRQGSDEELYKENEVIGLISRCEVANWPLNETGPDGHEVDTAFDKLAGYIRFCVEDEPTTLGQLWRGMSSDEIPENLKSKVLVRRLTIVPLNDPTSHSIVANTFRYVRSNLNPAERSTADRVNEKRPEGGGGDDEDKTSFIEANKTKVRIPPGDICAFNVDTHDSLKLTMAVDPTINLDILKKCMEARNNITTKEICPHQVLLAQWVMAKAFPARAFYHIEKLAVNNLIAMSQALLWHWGFKDIAVFMQVELMYYGEHQSAHQLSQPRSGTRIPIKYKADMDECYPHHKQPKIPGFGEPPKSENRAGVAINSVNQSIRSSNWLFRGPDELFTDAGQVSQNGVLIVPQTIKATITELVIFLAKLNN